MNDASKKLKIDRIVSKFFLSIAIICAYHIFHSLFYLAFSLFFLKESGPLF